MTWRDKVETFYLEWETFGLFAIAGQSGSGKSSTTRFLLAQLALNNVGLVICDGHGRAGIESLAESVQPLSAAFLYPIAIDPKDVLESVRYIETIMRRRLNKQEPIDQKIAIVIDEFTSLMLRMTPEQAKEVTKLLILISQEARKTNVRGFLLGHNWSANFLGSAAIRDNLSAKLLHRLAPNEVKLFLPAPPAPLLRSIGGLKQGQAYLITQRLDPTKVHIPYITTDDLESVAKFVPDIRNNYDYDIESALESVEMSDEMEEKVGKNSKITLKYIYETIVENRRNNIGKTKTIYEIWGAKPGGSDVYKAASKLYDAIVKDYDNKFGKTAIQE